MKQGPRKAFVTACTNNTKYELVRDIVEDMGMVNVDEEDSSTQAHLVWSDSATPVTVERVRDLQRYQRINHFPGMEEICRKDYLARNMARIKRLLSAEYNFIPQTWILPSEYHSLVLHCENNDRERRRSTTFIAKPVNGAMGNGIYLFRNPERLLPLENMVVQNYLERPFLLDGYKIDLRLYVLITSCDPLRAFLYKDGLVRLGTEKYTAPSGRNMDSLFMHLTNYSVNKCHEKFERHSNANQGSKRSVKSLMKYLQTNGRDTNTLWRKIIDVVVKTLIVACPHISHSYRASRPGDSTCSDSVCFEVLGFDIFLDDKLNPWLLEVNRTPSFGTDEQVDRDIKTGVLYEALHLLNMKSSDKAKSRAEEKAESQRRLLRPVRQSVPDDKKETIDETSEKIEKDADREEHENDTLKGYFRIFPPPEKTQQKKYTALLQKSFKLFSHTKQTLLEASSVRGRRLQRRTRRRDEVRPHTQEARRPQHAYHSDRLLKSEGGHRFERQRYPLDDNPQQMYRYSGLGSSLMLPRGMYKPPPKLETEEEMIARTLEALEEVRIKFPGKTDMEARKILNSTIRNWDKTKSDLASYWLVDLDSGKRRKVIAIIRDNIKPILRKTFHVPNVDALKIMRYFDRVFNRMCSDYGRGLWDCFGESSASWEAIFRNEKLRECELECCRRVVELCKDCLLIVYQFAKQVRKLLIQKPQVTPPQPPSIANEREKSLVRKPGVTMPPPPPPIANERSDVYPMYLQLSQGIPKNSFLRGLLTQ